MTQKMSHVLLDKSLIDDDIHGTLNRYFHNLKQAYERAAQQSGNFIFEKNLAGHRIRLSCNDPNLYSTLTRSLAHLPTPDTKSLVELEIIVWDETTSGVSLPDPPWLWPERNIMNFRFPPGGDAFRIHRSEDMQIFCMFHIPDRRAIMTVKDIQKLPVYVQARPFRDIFDWWRRSYNLHILHAGCVGHNGKGALIVGPSGAGKSTTALSCALNGMNYLGDDLCLISEDMPLKAISLYASGNLHSYHLKNFPELAKIAIYSNWNKYEKPMIMIDEARHNTITAELDIKVIIAPKYKGALQSRIMPISSAEGLKALAPSTLVMNLPFDARDFKLLSNLVRHSPCYRLELGHDTGQIADLVRSVL